MSEEEFNIYTKVNMICTECKKMFMPGDIICIERMTNNTINGKRTETRIHKKCVDLLYKFCIKCKKRKKDCRCKK